MPPSRIVKLLPLSQLQQGIGKGEDAYRRTFANTSDEPSQDQRSWNWHRLFPQSGVLYALSVIQNSDNGGLENSACLGLKNIGKPCAGIGVGRAFAKQKLAKLHARFDEGGQLQGCFLLYRLADEYIQLANVHLAAIEHKHSIVFLHSVSEGAASQSYGLQVAALAGVPRSVIKIAQKQLQTLEQNSATQNPQGDLFSAVPDLPELPEHPVLILLRDITPDELSPKEALEKLYQLKKLVWFSEYRKRAPSLM